MAHYAAPARMATAGYPPAQDVIYPTMNSTTSTIETKVNDEQRQISRTPSPTPSELKEMKSGAIDWNTLKNWRFWIRREWLWYYVIFAVILIVTALVTIFHTQIVNWLTPVTQWLHDLKFGWLVPIGILFVISFPPLFGHEIVAILCGLVWGLGVGFAIVAAGTFLGEVGNFYAFKYCCRARGEKMEKTNITYACLSKVVRDGGFKIALIARLSAIPGHFTTAIFSTCGMNIFVFSLAAILSLPKQFITVYLGVILKESSSGTEDRKSKIISDAVLAVTFAITGLAMWYILREMNRAKPQVIYERRKARQAKLSRAGFSPYSNGGPSGSRSSDVFNPRDSDSDIPLTGGRSHQEPSYQQWDRHGKAVGYVPDPKTNFIFNPKPRVTNAAFMPPARDLEEAGATRPLAHAHEREDSTDAVGWETAPPMMATREFNRTIPPGAAPSTAPAAGYPNPYASRSPPPQQQPQYTQQRPNPNHQQSTFVSATPPMTPRQVDYGFAAQYQPQPQQSQSQSSWQPPPLAPAAPASGPRSPFEQTYGGYGYDDPYDSHARGHTQEPTDATFRTAFTSSPDHHQQFSSEDSEHDPRTPMPNPYAAPGAHQPLPPPTQGYSPNLR